MKKTLLVLCSFMLGHYAMAQFTKGAKLVGGDVGFNHSTSDNATGNKQKNTTINTTFSYGVAVNQKRFIGASVYYGHSNWKNDYNTGISKSNSNTYGLAVFARDYKQIAGNFFLFGQLNVYGNINRQNYDYITGETADVKGFSTGINIVPGLSYKVSKKLFAELSIPALIGVNYQHIKQESSVNPDTKANSFNFSTAFSDNSNGFDALSLGFRFIF